jgi:type III pantothenate kinase
LFAAHALAGSRPVLVANVGTALTLDTIASDGRHLGGAIAPGPATMIASLLEGTQGIRRRARGARKATTPVRRLFVADTASALEAGAAYSAAGLIERAVAEAREAFGRQPLLLLTGGGAPRLRTYIRVPCRVVPDLVLRGLAQFAESRM